MARGEQRRAQPRRPTLRPVLDLEVLTTLPGEETMPVLDMEPAYNDDGPRRPRASFRVSQGGSTLNLVSCNRSQEFAIGPQGLRQHTLAGEQRGGAECSASDMMEFNVIGRGASSVVKKAIHVPSHRFVALKCISVLEKDKRQQLLNELRLMCDGSTNNVRGVVAYIGTYFVPEHNTINVALEFMDGGSLEGLLARRGALPEGVLARVAADVLEGLAWLHRDKRMIHRDIKPANILLNLQGEPKITDFGISTGADACASVSRSSAGAYKGTLCYMSPERLNNRPYGFNADVWSLGVTLAECALGRYPFRTDQGPVGTVMEILEGELPVGAVAGSPECRDFLGLCMLREPGARPGADGLRAHPWICRAALPHATLATFVAAAFDPAEGLLSLAQMFVAHFYRLLDGPPCQRSSLAGLYRADAALCVAGAARARGPDAICALLARALGETAHSPAHVDCQAWGGGGVLVLVSGTVIAAFETAPFSDAFALLPGDGDGRWFVVHHWRTCGGAAVAG